MLFRRRYQQGRIPRPFVVLLASESMRASCRAKLYASSLALVALRRNNNTTTTLAKEEGNAMPEFHFMVSS